MVKHYPWYDCNVGIKVPFEQCHISANDTTAKELRKYPIKSCLEEQISYLNTTVSITTNNLTTFDQIKAGVLGHNLSIIVPF